MQHGGGYRKLTDIDFIKLKWEKAFGYEIDLDNPKTFNEKLQWLKLYDRNCAYTQMVDKFLVKEYVAEKLGKEYIIPSIGVWNSIEEIDFGSLPSSFVLKCTHDSGGLVLCKDKSRLDIKSAKRKLQKSLDTNYYEIWREWPYKDVVPRIIAEEYIGDNPIDYKIHCFNGEPQFILVCSNRNTVTGLNEDFFDVEWRHLDIKRPDHLNSKTPIEKPNNLGLMLELSRTLARTIPFCRIDFYEKNKKVLFGEITFFPSGGFAKFEPQKWDLIFGNMLMLPEKNEN